MITGYFLKVSLQLFVITLCQNTTILVNTENTKPSEPIEVNKL